MKKTKNKYFAKSDIFLIPVCLIFLYPFYYLIISTFKTQKEIAFDPVGFPEAFYLENYKKALGSASIYTAFVNTFLLTVVSVLVIVVIGEMAAYPIVFHKNRLNTVLLYYLMIGFLIPFQATLLALFEVMKGFGLLDSLIGMMVFYANGSALTVFLAVGYMRTIPKELCEAAIVDGASVSGVFFRIVFPLMKPITTTSIIFNTMWIWNDFMAPNIFLSSRSNATLVLEIFQAKGQFSVDWPMFMTVSVITIAPIFIFYIFMQKYIIKGLTAGAVKG